MDNYILIKKGEYAYNKSYSKDYPFGAIKMLKKYDYGALSTLYIVFKATNISPRFLESYYESHYWHKEINKIAAEGARNHGLLNLSTQDFFKTNIKIPSTSDEQLKISNIVNQLDSLITLHKESLKAQEKLYSILKSMIFKRRIFVHRYLINTLEEKPLKDLVDYDTSKRSLNSLNLVEKGYSVFDANAQLGFLDEYDIEKDYISIIKDGAGVGRTRVLPRKTSVISTMGYLIPKVYSARYTSHLVSTINFKKYIVGSTIPHVYFKDYKKEKFFVHDINTANYYDELLRHLERKIEKTNIKLTKLEMLKKFYLNNLFI